MGEAVDKGEHWARRLGYHAGRLLLPIVLTVVAAFLLKLTAAQAIGTVLLVYAGVLLKDLGDE